MSNKITFMLLIAFSFVITSIYSCSEKNSAGNGLLDPNGLTREINDIVPDSTLQKIKSLGMPVNTGDSPPNIEGSFLISPFVLDSTNIPGDWPIGTEFAEYYIKFSNQKNSDLSVNIDYLNGPEVGNGIGSFIVGQGSNFSVFAKVTTTVGVDSAYVLFLFSGSKQSDGLHDMFVAILMLDDLGDLSGYFIENNQGRIFHDSDGLSIPYEWSLLKQSAVLPENFSKISALRQR